MCTLACFVCCSFPSLDPLGAYDRSWKYSIQFIEMRHISGRACKTHVNVHRMRKSESHVLVT